MKKLLIFISLILMVSGCTQDDSAKAIDELLKNNKNVFSVHVFTNKSLDDSFIDSLQEKINDINNQQLVTQAITNISFIDIRDKNKYDYEKIFNLKTYPQILVFQNKELVFITNKTDDLYHFFKKRNS
ncbi:lipoprotein [Paenibacillus apii]|uniref:lipoprotein n=1 Tax=Paenibacillus apii TaxID=1850370 RepID=UPI00143A40AF|nr:lipoprotein [Paenibacillus apii]NJJ40728.1 hypothetical protein [Paenibacillus apii]